MGRGGKRTHSTSSNTCQKFEKSPQQQQQQQQQRQGVHHGKTQQQQQQYQQVHQQQQQQPRQATQLSYASAVAIGKIIGSKEAYSRVTNTVTI